MKPPPLRWRCPKVISKSFTNSFHRLGTGFCLLLALLACLYLKPGTVRHSSSPSKTVATNTSTLALATPVKQQIATGQKHRYVIHSSSSLLGFSLRPAGFGLIFAIRDAQGNLLRCGNSRRFGETRFSLLTQAPGQVVIEISKLPATTANLEYELTWLVQRSANTTDESRLDAEKNMEEAERLHEQEPAALLHLSVARYHKALSSWRKLADPHEIGWALFGLGLTHYYLSQEPIAITYLQQSLQQWRVLANREGEANTYLQLANARTDIGKVLLAKEDYQQALRLWEALGNTAGQASAKIGLGVVHTQLNNFQQALLSYEQALSIHRQFNNRLGETSALAGLGYAYLELGETRNAIDVSLQELKLAETLNLSTQQQLAHSLLGQAYLQLKDPKNALFHLEKALLLSQQHGHKRIEALLLRKIGVEREMQGEISQAGELYQRALRLSKQVKNQHEEALILNLIGNYHEAIGSKTRALAHYRQALPICRKLEDRLGEITTHHNLAHVQRDVGRLLEARHEIETALRLIESLRERVANRQLRESYFATVQKSYGLYVDILMRRHGQQPTAGHLTQAWQANEQARARTLREMLNENRVDVRVGLPATLLERERILQEQLNAKANHLLNVTNPLEIETLAREVRELRLRLADLEGEMRQAAPGYAALTQPPPLSVPAVQRKLLDERTALLEYALGEERSYVWLITRQGLQAKQLAKRSEIEAQARRVYDLLTARLQSATTGNGTGYGERIRQADAQYWQEAAKLSTMILPAEWLAQLPHTSLLVVSDGALQYLPFSALPLPGEANALPLLTRFEVTSLPSVTVLAELRRQQMGRQPRAKMLAVLADPVYNANDERLRSTNTKLADKTLAAAQSSPASNELQLRASDGSPISLMRLFNAEAEAEAIRKYATSEECLLLKGLEVNRSVLDGPQLNDFRILHFATHGYLNSEHPELSGMALSNFQPDGKQVDGLLRMHEIYRLRLPADLIVLSACETALGKEVRGEGLIALTRGFMYAGATRVVASLWKVNDATTPQLMDYFYAGMLKEKLSPAAALRQAQRKLFENERTRAPFYWAAFILQGEPRNFSSPPVTSLQR